MWSTFPISNTFREMKQYYYKISKHSFVWGGAPFIVNLDSMNLRRPLSDNNSQTANVGSVLRKIITPIARVTFILI